MTQVTEGRRLSMLARWKPLVALAGLVVALGSSANALAAPATSTRALTATAPVGSTAAASNTPRPWHCSRTARSSSPATRP